MPLTPLQVRGRGPGNDVKRFPVLVWEARLVKDSTMNRLVKCTLLITVCCASSAASVRGDDLRKHLAEIDMQKGRTKTEKLERDCLDLLDEYSSPADQGRIYAKIAHVHAQTGLKDPDKTAEYCEKALEYPLDLVIRVQMYGYWASALHSACSRQVHWGESPWDEFPDVRKEIAAISLRGIKLILDQGIPGERQPLPRVDKFSCHPPDSLSCQELVKRNKEQVRARRKARLENDLVSHHKILTEKCVYLYSQEPVDRKELEVLAREVLGDEGAVAELVARVASQIMDRADTPSTKGD